MIDCLKAGVEEVYKGTCTFSVGPFSFARLWEYIS